MSAGQPPSYPPPPPTGGGAPPPAPSRRGFFDQFKGLQWWEILLAVLPLGLVAIGGLIGAVIGILGMISNLAIARRVPLNSRNTNLQCSIVRFPASGPDQFFTNAVRSSTP